MNILVSALIVIGYHESPVITCEGGVAVAK